MEAEHRAREVLSELHGIDYLQATNSTDIDNGCKQCRDIVAIWTRKAVAGVEQIRVCSALDDSYNATNRNPVTAGTRPAHVGFGASDNEICVVSSFGLKFSVFDLTSSKASEIANPKFSSPSTASRGFSFRPGTRHLALLTRSAGKDMISVHDYPTRQLRLSWAPDTIDAQGILWSPDGKWLVKSE